MGFEVEDRMVGHDAVHGPSSRPSAHVRTEHCTVRTPGAQAPLNSLIGGSMDCSTVRVKFDRANNSFRAAPAG